MKLIVRLKLYLHLQVHQRGSGDRSGDYIEKVDGELSEELGLANTASKLRGETGTKVLVEIPPRLERLRRLI